MEYVVNFKALVLLGLAASVFNAGHRVRWFIIPAIVNAEGELYRTVAYVYAGVWCIAFTALYAGQFPDAPAWAVAAFIALWWVAAGIGTVEPRVEAWLAEKIRRAAAAEVWEREHGAPGP